MWEENSARNYKKTTAEMYFYLAMLLCGTTVVNAVRSCYERFLEYDVLFSSISGILLILWICYLIFHKRRRRKKVKDVVYFGPPSDLTAAEVAVLDTWGPTGRVFPAMLYDWVAKRNIRLGKTAKGEIYFEKITDNPSFFSDTKYIYAEHSAYNRDPEHDFWELCFATRTRVTIPMLMRMTVIERLPQDFFYQVQRQCLDWNAYKKEVRPLLNISWEIALWIPFSIVCFYAGVEFGWFLPVIVGLACLVRVLSLYLDMKRGSKYYYLTRKGAKIFEEVLGFKKYLLAVEDSKLKVVLKEDPTYFEKILPYAIAFGVGDGWLNKCFAHMQYDIFGGLVSDSDAQGFKTNPSELNSFVNGVSNTISFVGFKKDYKVKGEDNDLLNNYIKNYSSSKYSDKRI